MTPPTEHAAGRRVGHWSLLGNGDHAARHRTLALAPSYPLQHTGPMTADPQLADAPSAVWQVRTRDPAETRALGERLGALATQGAVLLLQGELGSGKTVVAQGVGRGLGVPGVVNSPTFVLVNEHLGGRLPMLHADLYRLDDAGEIAELVLDELAADGVLLVEWPERSSEPIAEDVLRLTITPGPGPQDRSLVWEARGGRSGALLGRLRAAVGPAPAPPEAG